MTHRIPRLIRRIAAVLILVCLVLPMSRCTTGTRQVDAQERVVATNVVHDDIVAVELLDEGPEGALWLFAFAWPALSQLLLAWRRRLEGRRIYLSLEVLLILPTAWLGYGLATLGQELRYGAFILAASLAAYLLATLAMLRRPPRMDGVDSA